MAAFAVVLTFAAPTALADTTVIGEQTLVPSMANADMIGQNIPVFQGDAGAGYVLSSPRTGTITSWSFLSGGIAAGKQFELAVLAPTDAAGQSWRLLATSAPQAVTTATGTDALNGPFAVQIAIDVGDRIALMPVNDSSTPIETGTNGVDGIRYFAAPFASLGSSQQVAPGSTADNGQVVPIQATVTFSGTPLPPANTKLPSVSGTARQFETLTGDPGLWQNGVTKFAYSWLRCAPDGTSCVGIPGSNSTSYTLTRSDVGFTMRFQVIASNDGGDSQPVQSAPTAVVQRGLVTASLSLSPNPSCTGVPTTFDASGSVSPDGIKSYSFRVVDLYAAGLHYARTHGQPELKSELDALFVVAGERATLLNGGPDAQYLIDNFAGPPLVTEKATAIYTFDWNREVVYNPNVPFGPAPGTLARDPVGVVLVVTDYAGKTSQAVDVLSFKQIYSVNQPNFPTRADCPKAKPFRFTPPDAVLTPDLIHFPGGSSQPSTTVRCQTRVACVGSITVALRGSSLRASAAAQRKTLVLASGFFKIPPNSKHKIVLTLTQLGKSRLHRGARVPIRVTVLSASPTGRSVTHIYSEVLTR